MDELVEGFMRTEAHKVDVAFAVSSVFDQQRAVFRKAEPADELKKSMQQYIRLGLEPRMELGLDEYTWDSILDLLATSRRDYEAKASGFRGMFRKAWRKAGDNSTRIAPLFEMIPDDTGLSVLKGGLGWILTMAKESSKKREAIFSAFESIPEVFAMAAEKRKVFRDHSQLEHRIASLHATVVSSIMLLISFLLPNRRVNLPEVFPFIKHIPTEKDVNSILSLVDRKSQALKQDIANVTEAAIMDTHKQVSSIPQKLDNVQSILQEIKSRQLSTADTHYNALSEQFGIEAQNALRPLLEGLMKDFERGLELLMRQIQTNQFLAAIELYRPLTPLPLHHVTAITTEQLLHALRVHAMDVTNDLQTVLRSVQQLDHGAYQQTSVLLQNYQFKRWCSSIDPDILLVDANVVDSAPTSKISPLSSACASIIASIVTAQPNAIPLFFFCGLHTAPHDTLQGPQGLMRTLMARLLVELDGRNLANLGFIDTHGYLQALEAHQVPTLCHAFMQLIRQWPLDTVVYCIIDGIGWCDHVEWSEDLAMIVNVMYELVRDRHLRPIFKVLISSPMRSRTVLNVIPQGDRILLGAEARPAREEFLPERYVLLNQTKAEYMQIGGSEDVKDDDFYT